MEKRRPSIRILPLLFVLCFVIISSASVASAMSFAEFDAKVNAFISDPRWCNGAPWGNRGPAESSWSSSGCCAYVADFTWKVYGISCPSAGAAYKVPAEISKGDILHFHNGKSEHWIAVLNRDGNTLYTAEGNVGNKVLVSSSRYFMNNDTLWGNNEEGSHQCTFWEGYHYDVVPGAPADTVKPVISNVSVTNRTSKGYTVTCTVTDNVGVTNVQFPTWREGTPVVWYDGTYLGNNRWTFTYTGVVEDGNYITQIYGWDAAANYGQYNLEYQTYDKTPPSISIQLAQSGAAGFIICDVKDNVKVSSVQLATQRNGGSTVWYNGVSIADNSWSFSIPFDNASDGDWYDAQIYAWDSSSNQSKLNVKRLYVEKTKPVISDVTVSDKGGSYEVRCKVTCKNEVSKVTIQPLCSGGNWNQTAGGYNTIKMNKLSGGKYYGSFEKREGAERYQVVIRAYGITENAAKYVMSFNPDEIKSDTPEEPQDDRKDVSTLDSRYYLSKAIYTGRELTPVFVKDGDTILTEGVDYTISYTDNVNAGKGRFTITGIGKYKGTKSGSFTITKAKNSIVVSVKTVTISFSKLKKKTQTATIKAVVSGESANASFKLLSVPKKAKPYITLSTSGKFKIKKGISKGSYTVKFRATSEETSNYAKTYIDKSIKIIVK